MPPTTFSFNKPPAATVASKPQTTVAEKSVVPTNEVVVADPQKEEAVALTPTTYSDQLKQQFESLVVAVTGLVEKINQLKNSL